MTEVEQPPQNGIDLSANEDDDNSKARPADIEQDMREMERRKRVEAIMGSKLFREELERIVDSARDSGNADGILQQLSDIVGVPATRVGSVFKASNCMQPINDIRGVESMGYAKGEKILRCKLAATFRLLDLYGWTQGLGAQITARLKVDQEYFLVNPYGLLYHEITASSLNKVDMQGNIVEQGTTNFGVNKSHFVLHSVVHAARPDIRCAIYIGCSPVVAISSLKTGLLPLTKDACVLGDITTFSYAGSLYDQDERDKLVRNLGPNSKVMLLTNHGALCCGETIEEAFFAACHIVQACETQLKLLPVGLDNLVLISEESRKTIYEQSRRPPEDLAKKFAAANVNEEEDKKEAGAETTKVLGQPPKWRVGGAEFEALMRMLDNAGYRTGYIYRHPLIKTEPPKPKNDVELPPAVSSLGYLLEEEELFRQGIWKKGAMGKGGDRSRWLNSPNVYQKVEVLETGTPDPKKITKWVAEGSPTHSTPVRIDDPLQFVPVNTNPKEFKRLQQQIKENRRADKISAGPQSHILEGVTWDEANRIKDATVSQAGDHVVLMGAASKGIIQRGFQHNATVYKAPYAKNPFDNVTDDELNEYKRTVERKKKSIHGEYTDTDFSESEALSSLQTSGAQQQTKQNTTTTTTTAAVSQSEPEDISEHRVMRIETQQAPVPSQPEVVLSDATLSFINGERSHTATNRKPPTGRGENVQNGDHSEAHLSTFSHSSKEFQDISTDGSPKKDKKKKKGLRTPSFLKKKKEKKKAEA
ncbi:adducin 1-like protein hts isoform X2 [Haematobia irritans]|uniref:adducin 1-like protein hts isoform X2 n=1 Tax=Haematobia irritans TaxID=7368 RepID=UPI003F4F4587